MLLGPAFERTQNSRRHLHGSLVTSCCRKRQSATLSQGEIGVIRKFFPRAPQQSFCRSHRVGGFRDRKGFGRISDFRVVRTEVNNRRQRGTASIILQNLRLSAIEMSNQTVSGAQIDPQRNLTRMMTSRGFPRLTDLQ